MLRLLSCFGLTLLLRAWENNDADSHREQTANAKTWHGLYELTKEQRYLSNHPLEKLFAYHDQLQWHKFSWSHTKEECEAAIEHAIRIIKSGGIALTPGDLLNPVLWDKHCEVFEMYGQERSDYSVTINPRPYRVARLEKIGEWRKTFDVKANLLLSNMSDE